jgi:hypothetical protein
MESFMALANSLPLRTTPAAALPPAATPGNPEFLTNDEAAAFLRLSPRSLEKHRVLGGGPRYRKFGARVLYAVGDLRIWADGRAYGMTSDPGSPQRATVR